MATKKINKFEAFLGNQWQAWAAGDNATIKQNGRIVVINIQHPEHGAFETRVDLDLVPAYTIQ